MGQGSLVYDGKKYYSLEDAARFCGLSVRAFQAYLYQRRLIKADKKIGGRLWFSRETLIDFCNRLAVYLCRMTPDGVGLFTTTEAAGMLVVSRQTIHNWVKTGRLVPDVRRGRRIFFTLDTIQEARKQR